MNPKQFSHSKKVKYVFYNYLGQIMNAINSIIIRIVLPPTIMGDYAFLQMIYSYFDLSHLGLRFSIDKLLPIEKNEEKKIRIFSVGISYSILFSIIAYIFTLIIIIILYRRNTRIIFGLIILEAASFFMNITNFKKAFFRANEVIDAMNFFAIVYINLSSLLKIIFVLLFKYWGVVFAYFLSNFLFFLIFNKKFTLKFRFNFDKKFFIQIFSIGFPLFLNSLVTMTYIQIDKWAALIFMGKDTLGFYSTPLLFANFMLILPNSLSEVFFPRIIKSFQKGKEELITYVKKLSLYLVGLNILVSLFVSIIIPYVVNWFLPEYVNTILAAQIIVFSSIPVMINSIIYYSLIALNKHNTIFIINTISLFISMVFVFTLTYIFQSLVILAISALISRIIQVVIMFIYFKKSLN